MKTTSTIKPSRRQRLTTAVASALILLGAAASSNAADVSLNASDAVNTTSWNAAGHWNNSQAPGPGNNYFTAGFTLRSPASGGSVSFAGDSLTLQPLSPTFGVCVNIKFNSGSFLIINNCTNASGVIGNGNGGTTYGISGNMVFTAPAGPCSFALAGDASRFLILSNLNMSGSAMISNGYSAGPNGLGTIVYAGNATTFTGPLITSAGTILRAYSQTNLGANPSSFNAAQFVLDNGIFTPLASMSFDNANSGVSIYPGGGTFNIGSGINFTNANPLAGSGALTKSGVGVMVQNGSGAGFTGNTTVSAGTLAIGPSGSLSGSPVINVAGGAILDASAAGLIMSTGQQLIGAGTINGNVTDASGCTINAGSSGSVTNLTFGNNLTLVNGGNIGVAFNAATNGYLTVNGNLSPSGITYINIITAPPGGFVNA